MPRGGGGGNGLQRSGSNTLASLLRADPPPPPTNAGKHQHPKKRTSRRKSRRSCLRLLPPLVVGAGGCRVCACDELDPAAPPPRRRPPEEKDYDDEEEGEIDDGEADAVVMVVEAVSISELPDDVVEMVLSRLPLSSLLAARCVCRRWRDITVSPQFARMRRPHRTPWLFLAGVEGDDGWGAASAGGADTAVVHALDVESQRWRRVEAEWLKGRYLFSVAGVGDELYVVGGRSDAGATAANANAKTNTHKGVLVYSPLAGAWRKAAPMRTARSRPVLGVFEMGNNLSRSILHSTGGENHLRRHVNSGGKFRLGGTSAVYEDPHRLSLRRLRLRDVLLDAADDSSELAMSDANFAGGRLALIAVGGRGRWDEPLVSGEVYDSVRDKWFEIAGFPTDVGLACSGAVCGRMFYVYCESDTLVAYHLDRGFWSVIQTSRLLPPRLRDYPPALLCCSSRLLMLCVSWCDGEGERRRREKVVRKVFELDTGSRRQWREASSHPDAPMDANAAFAAGEDTIYAVEMFRIFGKVLDFVTACRVSEDDDGSGRRWCRLARKNAVHDADAMSGRLKSMAALHL
uniref:F-box domain-containing protein n=1 Tax=Leersia perrieri TaxID=77586 RepID=A0A0D9XGK3_9ORYZ